MIEMWPRVAAAPPDFGQLMASVGDLGLEPRTFSV